MWSMQPDGQCLKTDASYLYVGYFVFFFFPSESVNLISVTHCWLKQSPLLPTPLSVEHLNLNISILADVVVAIILFPASL